MRKTGRPRSERVAAWTAVFIVHALLGWALLRAPVPARDARETDTALDLVWIAAPRAVSSIPRERVRATPAGRPPMPERSVSPHRESSAPPVPEAEAPPPAQALSADFIQQAIERATREPPGSLQVDPFANRTARLPGRAANRFRMRPPPSLAERVARVGKLFGNDDPCRSARDSVNELAQEGDSRVLQDVLDYERRHCR